ncbi:partial [Paramuricea clavata]|uniref:Partial n=1 Tax=Paramuricea clavata TaxID=317549 RepID=A0A6S7K485_PARCT|nr:partial [Paramuricea clavata]
MKLKNFYHLHGHRLKVSPQATLEVAKDVKCTVSCMRNEDCFSFNVKKISSNLFLCELLNTSKFLDSDNLTRDENFAHWYLQEPCNPLLCGDESQGKCVIDSDGTAVSCNCSEKYEAKRCEIRIYDAKRNYALNKPTTASVRDYISQRAVDGNSNSNWYGNSCYETLYEPVPHWWRVNFEEEIQVARVVITNRGDCCGDRLSNFGIKIGNSLKENGVTNPACGETHLAVPQGQTKTFACSPPMKGQYLVIHSFLTDRPMVFCEVQAYAYP